MLNLKSKVSEKQPFRCILYQLNGEITHTTMRQEFKNEHGFEVKMPFCHVHSELTPDVVIGAIKKAFTPPEDPQMKFDDEDGGYAPEPEMPTETKAVAIRRNKRG